MSKQQIRIFYINACCALSESNKGNVFVGSKSECMRDINF